jgi:hypothetical protein
LTAGGARGGLSAAVASPLRAEWVASLFVFGDAFPDMGELETIEGAIMQSFPGIF